jgi:hypothetical protein
VDIVDPHFFQDSIIYMSMYIISAFKDSRAELLEDSYPIVEAYELHRKIIGVPMGFCWNL